MKPDITLKPLQKSQIPKLTHLPPEEWNFNIVDFMNKNYNKPYFHALVVMARKEIIGLGNIILTGNSSWLGNIIVQQNYRRNHIGKKITEYLVDYSYRMKCKTVNLMATDLGRLLYVSLGFREISTYRFFKNETGHNRIHNINIHPMKQEDMQSIIEIDKSITGEDRSFIYKNADANGCVYKSGNEIIGYYHPGIGNGVILAIDKTAGTSLLSFKHINENTISIFPEKNIDALNYCRSSGFNEYFSASRMVVGNELPWKPEGIFCRIAGWIG